MTSEALSDRIEQLGQLLARRVLPDRATQSLDVVRVAVARWKSAPSSPSVGRDLALIGSRSLAAALALHVEPGGAGHPAIAPLLAISRTAAALGEQHAREAARSRRRAGPILRTVEALRRHLHTTGHARDVRVVGAAGTLAWRDADFRGALFEDVTLFEADLQGARFDEARFSGSRFEASLLEGASFRGATLEATGFRATALGATRWGDASLLGVDLTDANLTGVDLRDARTVMDPELAGTLLREARFRVAELRGAKLAHRDLGGASFEACNLAKAELDGAKLDGVDLTGAVLDGASLRAASGRAVKAARASLAGADLMLAQLPELDAPALAAPRARIARADLSGARLLDATFEGASFDRVLFTRADLSGARFVGAELRACSFVDASLRHADFSNASAFECLFARAALDGANLHRMKEDKNLWDGADRSRARSTDPARARAEDFSRSR